jgi:glycosyltransferase involved in cell wall biosynthesis
MPASELRIAVVSDVTLGYGGPQVQSLARSLASHYRAQTTVFEPDEGNRPILPLHSEFCRICRITTEMHPYSASGRIEYVLKVARQLNLHRPEILVIFCTYALPVLTKLRYRPRCTIYSMIESVLPYGAFDVQLNRSLARQIDVLLFPEENRARLDIARCGLSGIPLAVTYNVSDAAPAEPTAPQQRLPRILQAGLLSRQLGLADYFLQDEVRTIPFDLFGDIAGPDREALAEALTDGANSVRYWGRVDAATLASIRRTRAYCMVMYAPIHEHTLYACPNKFFEAVADGVPPIAAPHPQCKMLLERYRCGILMQDWSFPSFQAAVTRAMRLFGTPRYAEMVANCRKAVQEELNWETQFNKVKRLLPEAA